MMMRQRLAAAMLTLGLLALQDGASAQQADSLRAVEGGLAGKIPGSRAEMQLSFAPIVKRAAPAVVNIYSRRVVDRRRLSPMFNDPFFGRFLRDRGFGIPRKRVQRSLGSGVVVRADGVIITNHHVIRGGTDIEVVLNDGRDFGAEVILKDEKTDLAVLKIDTRGEALPFLQLDDSDTLEVGDLVLAIGNPFGVGQTVTSGIVSAQARTQAGISDFQFFIQTDAAINPGNSGGALINMDGGLVGINTAIFSRSGGSNGIGFAIPSNMVRAVIESSRVGGNVRRPWVGARLQSLTPAIADSLGLRTPLGALIQKTHPQSPLARAGLRRGDVIVEMDGKQIRKPQELRYRFATKRVGGRSTLVFWRNGRQRSVQVALTAAPDLPRAETRIKGRNPFSGARVANLSPALAEELRLTSVTEGVVILKVERGAARRIGFRRGDVILQVQGVKIHDIDDLASVLSRRQRVWSFAINRKGRVLRTRVEG